MRIYVSGPMTGYPAWNFPAFNAAEAALTKVGHRVENPATKGLIDGWDWSAYLRFDLRMLLDCDAVAVLDGWEDSRGARLEVYVAEALGMPVKHWADWS